MRHAFPVLALLSLQLLGPAAAAPLDLASDEFPIVMFSVDGHNPKTFERVKDWGIDYVHSYGTYRVADPDPDTRAFWLKYMDIVHACGLKVMVTLNAARLIKEEGGLEKLRGVVETYKDHPALGFWYLADEPDNQGVAPGVLRSAYTMVKEETPGVPVAVCHAWSKHWRRYGACQDILMNDNYPVYDDPFPRAPISNMTRFTRQAVSLDKPVIPVLQAINRRHAASATAETFRGRPVKDLRYPTQAEIRYWCYSSLIVGVRGLAWWSHYRSQQVDRGKWLINEFAPVIREFREFTDTVRPATKLFRYTRAEDQNLYLALWVRGEATHLVLVNAWPLGRTVRRGFYPKPVAGVLAPWGRTRDAEAGIEGGKLLVEAEPWEVFVWTLEGSVGRPVITPAE